MMPNCLDCATPLKGHGKPKRCKSCSKQGSRHGLWKGQQIEYAAAHHRVRRARGYANEHSCHDCGSPAEQWSYDHQDPNEIVSQKKRSLNLFFSLDVTHYVPRCTKCHMIFDERIPYGRDNRKYHKNHLVY